MHAGMLASPVPFGLLSCATANLHHDLSATRALPLAHVAPFNFGIHIRTSCVIPFRSFPSIPPLSQPGQGPVVAVPQPVCGRVQVHSRAGSAAPRVQGRAVRAVHVHAQAQTGGAARHDQPSWYFFRLIANARTCRFTFAFFGVLVCCSFVTCNSCRVNELSTISLLIWLDLFSDSLLASFMFPFTGPRLPLRACSQAGRARVAARRVGNVQARVWQRTIGRGTDRERARKTLNTWRA